MNNQKRLAKALAKIEKRKKRQRENGITEPTRFGYALRILISPAFRFGLGLMYPKSGHVHLGNTKKKDIIRLIKGQSVIYAPAHRGFFDVPRLMAYVLPQSYLINGVEKYFYCTINEHLIKLNGVLYVDREDSADSKMVIERASKILKSNHSITIYPEGTPNIYGKDMLKLYSGVIKMSLNTGAVVIPVGNQVDIVRNRSGQIVNDVNYTMYEDYSKQSLFRPADDNDLVLLHNYLKDSDYGNISDNKEIETFIKSGLFQLGDMTFDLNEKMSELLISHPLVNGYYRKLPAETEDSALLQNIRDYLIKCSILYEYRKRLISCLSILEQRMKVLSEMIVTEIDKRHPTTQEERERNEREYVDYFLDIHEKVAKKGRSTAYEEIDRFINNITDESIIESNSRKIIEGIVQIDNHAK